MCHNVNGNIKLGGLHMRKQFMILLTVATMLQGTTLMANEQKIVITNEEQQMTQENETKNAYITEIGKITEINEEDGSYQILVGTSQEGTIYRLNNGEVIIDAETLTYLTPEQIKKGMSVTVVVPKNSPVALSLPAISSSQVAVIVNSENTFINQDYFNEELVNESNNLALNLDNSVCILSTTGEKRIFTTDDIKNQNAIVFYTSSTRSIPAQTTPKMVLILPSEKEPVKKVADEENIQKDVQPKAYMPIRELAMAHHYQIKWIPKTKTVELANETNTISLTVGKTECIYNGSLKPLSSEVKFENQRVCVPEDFAKLL